MAWSPVPTVTISIPGSKTGKHIFAVDMHHVILATKNRYSWHARLSQSPEVFILAAQGKVPQDAQHRWEVTTIFRLNMGITHKRSVAANIAWRRITPLSKRSAQAHAISIRR